MEEADTVIVKIINTYRSYFSSTILNRGWHYYENRAVRQMQMEGLKLAKAKVRGSFSYTVTINLESFHNSSCSCPYGGYCKHMAAVLFEIFDELGYNPKDLRKPVQRDLFGDPIVSSFETRTARPKAQEMSQVPTTPRESESTVKWHQYFEKQFEGTTAYNVYYVDELYKKAFNKLYPIAEHWNTTIRGIYRIHVQLFLMKLCESKYQQLARGYYSYQEMSNYSSAISKDCMEKLYQALADLNSEDARAKYPLHLAETCDFLAEHALKGYRQEKMDMTEAYRLLWWNLLNEESLMSKEQQRLRLVAADSSLPADTKDAAIMALAHFEAIAGRDEEAWRLFSGEVERFEPAEVFGYFHTFVQVEQWDRLANWLQELLPLLKSPSREQLVYYFNLWKEAAKHRELKTQVRQAMIALLPGSYPWYSAQLLGDREYRQWVDLCLLMELTPFQLGTAYLKEIEKENVRLLLPLYHRAVEQFVQEKSRDSYKLAVKLLKKLAQFYKKLKEPLTWERYIGQLSKEYVRYRAFQEELRKGKLIS